MMMMMVVGIPEGINFSLCNPALDSLPPHLCPGRGGAVPHTFVPLSHKAPEYYIDDSIWSTNNKQQTV
jgi:hypothetical protein